jgi:hypothetical protein
MPVQLGGLHKAHDGRCALTGHQRSGEQPVLSTGDPRPDLLLVEVVVDGQRRIMQVGDDAIPSRSLLRSMSRSGLIGRSE